MVTRAVNALRGNRRTITLMDVPATSDTFSCIFTRLVRTVELLTLVTSCGIENIRSDVNDLITRLDL